MTVARITRVHKIGNYRAFQSWSDGGISEPFQRVNLIYGTNGSGKTTLACLLQECAESSAPAGLRLQLNVDIGGTPSVIRESSPGFWDRVRVFNRSYVDTNLRFDDENGPSPDSLLTLGESNVASEEELAERKGRREAVRADLATARSSQLSGSRQIETRLSAVAKTIQEELQASRIPAYRGTNVYTKANVRGRLDGNRAALDVASIDVGTDIVRATTARLDPVNLANAPSRAATEAVERVRELLQRDVVVKVLEELRGRGDRAAWVQSGIPLHEGVNVCLFCGQPLTDDRLHALAAHFDDALRRLQAEIDREISQLEGVVAASKQYLDRFPAARDFYAEFAQPLADAHFGYESEHKVYADTVLHLVDLLRTKRDNPFQVPELAVDAVPVPPSTAAIERVVADHRARSEAHAAQVEEAALRVECARIATFADEYDHASKESEDRAKLIARLDTEMRELDSRIATLENVSADPMPKAEELTAHVARLLGRSGLQFTTAPDGLHYSIERDGHPARHLSEGERTAIALLHFLASVRSDVVTGDEPILVIDDPVSSLDNEILFGASSFLWAGLVPATHLAQIFLLTHNFELFRQWLVQFERTKATEIPGGYTVHELRMRFEQACGSVRRVPRLEPWTHNRKLSGRLRSQYHFWFARVAQTLVAASTDLGLAERMDLLALAPNAARRMMEGFLSFRFPEHIGNFHAGMGAALAKIDDPALRNRVERYLHAYSHNEEGDISAMLDPSEATSVFRGLFELMKSVDPEHLTGMCDSLGIDEAQLLGVVPIAASTRA